MDWLITLAVFAALVVVGASRGWWLLVAAVVLVDLVAVLSWVSATRRPHPQPWEDPLPDFGPLLWAVLAMFATLGAALGWTIRLYRSGERRRAAALFAFGVVPVGGLWVVAAI